MTVILDPGHGMSNRTAGKFDPGAVSSGIKEADIAMDWANEIRGFLMKMGHKVVRTRVDHKDPAPVGKRAGIARDYGGQIMLSIHCNSTPGASGTETFYRGAAHRKKAQEINNVVVSTLGTRDRGVKTEGQSQHSKLAVMSFQPCFLLEIGFIDSPEDRKKMLDPDLRNKACEELAKVLVAS